MPQSVKLSINPKLNSDYELIRFDLDGDVPVADLNDALGLLGKFCQPLDPKETAVLLKRLHALSRPQPTKNQNDIDILVEAFLIELQDYPGDVVRECLESWPRNSPWFPDFNSLVVDLDWRNRRGKLRDALRKKRDKTNAAE